MSALSPIQFTPTSSNYSGQVCQGVNIVLVDRNTLDAPELGTELATALHRLYADQFQLEKMKDLLVNQAVYGYAISQGQDAAPHRPGLAGGARCLQQTPPALSAL